MSDDGRTNPRWYDDDMGDDQPIGDAPLWILIDCLDDIEVALAKIDEAVRRDPGDFQALMKLLAHQAPFTHLRQLLLTVLQARATYN